MLKQQIINTKVSHCIFVNKISQNIGDHVSGCIYVLARVSADTRYIYLYRAFEAISVFVRDIITY